MTKQFYNHLQIIYSELLFADEQQSRGGWGVLWGEERHHRGQGEQQHCRDQAGQTILHCQVQLWEECAG